MTDIRFVMRGLVYVWDFFYLLGVQSVCVLGFVFCLAVPF